SYAAGTGVTTLSQLTLSGSTVNGNTAVSGGGILCVLCTLTTSNNNVIGNLSSNLDGAGLDMVGDASTASITRSTFTSNTGAAQGGAISVPDGAGAVTIDRTRILGNGATSGSGIYNDAATVTATNNWWGCNNAPGMTTASGCTTAVDTVA